VVRAACLLAAVTSTDIVILDCAYLAFETLVHFDVGYPLLSRAVRQQQHYDD
jgi:hypothetical protein